MILSQQFVLNKTL